MTVAQAERVGGRRRERHGEHQEGWGRVIGTTLVGATLGAGLGALVASQCFSLDGESCAPQDGTYIAEMAALGAGLGAVSFGVPALVAHAGVDPLWIGASGAVLGVLGGAQGKDTILNAAEGAAGGGLAYLAIGYYNRNPR
jgi:hypothetical protein